MEVLRKIIFQLEQEVMVYKCILSCFEINIYEDLHSVDRTNCFRYFTLACNHPSEKKIKTHKPESEVVLKMG